MKHTPWFKLLLRVVGVLLIAYSVPGTFHTLAYAVWITDNSASSTASMTYTIVEGIGYVIQLGIGLYLLFDARWLIRVCIADATTRCPACRYDLTGMTPVVCPECGQKLPADIFVHERSLWSSSRSGGRSPPPPPLPGTSEPGSTSAKAEKSYNSGEEPSGPVA